MKRILIVSLFILATYSGMTQTIIELPAPVTTGGKPVMDALNDRHSARTFADSVMSRQQISNLLWAAYGINRPESGRRTAPSARNMQEFDVLMADKSGIYRYDADSNILVMIKPGDFRSSMGKQEFVGTASVVLIYVADYSRMGDMEESKKDFYSAADCAFISQNVYLYASSENLNTVVLGAIDRESMSAVIGLGKTQKIVFAQPVGFPAK